MGDRAGSFDEGNEFVVGEDGDSGDVDGGWLHACHWVVFDFAFFLEPLEELLEAGEALPGSGGSPSVEDVANERFDVFTFDGAGASGHTGIVEEADELVNGEPVGLDRAGASVASMKGAIPGGGEDGECVEVGFGGRGNLSFAHGMTPKRYPLCLHCTKIMTVSKYPKTPVNNERL